MHYSKTRMSSWLTEKEQDYVISWMNPHHHPSDEVLETWADLIRRIASKIPKSSKTSLAALGLEVVRIAGSEVYERVNADDLHEMEEVVGEMSEHMYLQLFSENSMPIDIGMIGRKAAFSPKAMNDFLDGDYAETRQRVMDIISQPPFEYTRELSKEDFREKVLEWCHVLAKEGIGSLAYPKKYGGSGNMGAYIAALETMSYFDLSLVIKEQKGTCSSKHALLKKVADLNIFVASTQVKFPCVDYENAVKIYNYLLYKVETSTKNWI